MYPHSNKNFRLLPCQADYGLSVCSEACLTEPFLTPDYGDGERRQRACFGGGPAPLRMGD